MHICNLCLFIITFLELELVILLPIICSSQIWVMHLFPALLAFFLCIDQKKEKKEKERYGLCALLANIFHCYNLTYFPF